MPDKQKTRRTSDGKKGGALPGSHGTSELFIQRPITTTLIMIGIVLFGFIGYHALPVSDLPTVDYPTVDEYAETLVAQRISIVDGVAQVQVYGAQKFAVRVQMDPEAMADRGIGVDDVSGAIRNGNPNTPVGTLYGRYSNLTLKTNDQL